MVNYTESAHSSTPAPLLTVPYTEEHTCIIEPSPEMTKQQGYEAGQADARRMLAQAVQSKGAPLTKREVREAVHPCFMAGFQAWETRGKPEGWYNGWCSGCTCTLREAERTAAPEPPVADQHPEVVPVPGTIAIRKATIKTENTHDLDLGIICGQEAYVDHSYDYTSITSHDLAQLFTETMNSDEPEEFNVGFLIGLVDALLRARKTYPRTRDQDRRCK